MAASERGLTSAFTGAGDPALADLRASFVFNPDEAEIRLGNRRMLLVDDLGMGLMRRELIEALGYERARGVMSRIGYGIGVTDAQFAMDLRKGGGLLEVYRAGPQLHALKGAVRVEELAFEADFAAGNFHGEYLWHNSAECLSHRETYGVGTSPAGWQQVGYASGYASTFFGRPMVFRETECVAMGHDCCRLVGKPADAWDDADAELRWFRAETYSRRPSGATNEATTDPDLRIGARAMVGASPQFNTALHLVDRVAPTRAPVLFFGESGVGKEVFARELHKRSDRAGQVFVAVNCAAIPDALLEAELFGVEKGAYTGAHAARPGRFERAAGGTLFLDEIGTLSLSAQGKLLRVLQEGEFERVGGTRTLTTDARLIAATNADLRAEVEAGRFRADLFHRINTFPIHLPPLRERKADIAVLANHFLQRLSERHGRRAMRFDAEVIGHFLGYAWPGNIREMENLIERGIILAQDGEPIRVHHLLLGGAPASGEAAFRADPFHTFVAHRNGAASDAVAEDIGQHVIDVGLQLEAVTDAVMAAALARSGGHVGHAATALGLTRSQVQYWKKQREGG